MSIYLLRDIMKITFRSNELEKLANGEGDHLYPKGIGKKYRFALAKLEELETIYEIRSDNSRKAEWKKWDRADQVGIWLNATWRLMLKFPEHEEWEVLVCLVREIVDYH